MRTDRWLMALILIVAGLVIYALYPLLIYGMELFLFVTVQGLSVLLALPQLLWWLAGAMFLTFWGLKLLLRLGTNFLWAPGRPLPAAAFHGRLQALRHRLYAATSGPFSQDEIRQLLRLLTIDLIALNLDLSEEEARKRFFQGDWTSDHVLKAYLYKERHLVRQGLGQRFMQWFRKLETPSFLQETGDILNHLETYRSFSDGEEQIDIADSAH
jgi:hypothetical protein